MSNGKLIVIEGTDCSGKETQTKLLVKRLINDGIKCIRLSFPMYDTPTGKIVGGAYLGKSDISESLFEEGSSNVDPYISCLYYAADRKYNIDKVLDYIKNGYVVILDRYTTSNMAHQGCKIADKDERFNMYNWIDKLEFWLLKLPVPDKTIFLHMPFKYSKILMSNRKFLDNNEKDDTYIMNAERAYTELQELYNWDKIECVYDDKIRSESEINDEIYKLIRDFLDK